MRRIQNQLQIILCTQSLYSWQLAGVSPDTDEHYRASAFCNSAFDRRRREAQELVHISEDRLQSLIQNRVVGGHKGQGSGNDFIAIAPPKVLLQHSDSQMQ